MRVGKWTIAAAFAALLLTFSCEKADPEVIIVPGRHWVPRTIAVVAPLGDANTKVRLERTADWFLENFKESQRLDTLAIDLKIEWYDELSEDAVDLGLRLAAREDIDAIIGPFGNDALAAFAPACSRREKPLIAPTTTSEEVVRSYAVPTSTGQKEFHPFLWALTESDVKLIETLISGHATMMKLYESGNRASGILLCPDDSYGHTFNYWAPFCAQNYDLDLLYNGLYSNPDEMSAKMATAIGANADENPGLATLCVVETAQQLFTATRTHRQIALDLRYEYLLGSDPDNPEVDDSWYDISTCFRPYFIYPNISEETIRGLGDVGRRMLQGYQGYTPYADPSTGFELAYQARFESTPTFAECKFYDALMLSSFALCYAEHQGPQPDMSRNRQINESIIAITAPAADESILSGAAWNPTVMQSYLKEMEKGNLYHFIGASADISFDAENFTATTHTTYLRWQIFNGKIVHSAYFGEDGSHSASHNAAWKYLYSQEQAEQDFETYTAGADTIEYPELTDQYAVLVQGSTGYLNYRHQADVLSMYQLLRKGGFDDDHIILILDKELANDPRNKEPGIIRNRIDSKDLMSGSDGLPKAIVDYDSATLSASDIADILLGNGSGKLSSVLPRNKSQNVFFYWSGHGRSQTNGSCDEFVWRDTDPGDGFTSGLLRQSAKEMLEGEYCRKLLVVAEPCYGESVVRPLEGIMGALAITGAAADEQSWADNWNDDALVWMSDRFTQNMVYYLYLYPEANYRDLFLYCAQHTLGSHAKIVNAACFGNLNNASLSEFIQYNH
ncbi:MAG: caspase family protein [Bacteroidales bacterium]|nr:caspase family protein [Bacteroidales bacterium]